MSKLRLTEHLSDETQLTGFWDIVIGSGPLSEFASDLEKLVVELTHPSPTYNNPIVDTTTQPMVVPGDISRIVEVPFRFRETTKLPVSKAIETTWNKKYYEASGGDVTGKSEGYDPLYQDIEAMLQDRTDSTNGTLKFYKGLPSSYEGITLTPKGDANVVMYITLNIMFNFYTFE